MKTNGEKISILRKSINLTQAELGAKVNVTSQAVSKWERDESTPDLATLNTLCSIFGITLDEFVNEKFSLIEKETKVKNENLNQLGFCTSCGVIVREENLGQKTPKMLCSECFNLEVEKLDKEAKALELNRLENQKNAEINRIENKKTLIKKYITSGIVPVIILIITLISSFKSSNIFASILFDIVFAIWVFAFIYQIRTPETAVRDAIFKFSWIIIRMPGIIFELSLDGIIWLITVKLLFWVITILLGLVALALGLTLSFAISFFTFPFVSMREISKLRA